ncbi:chemotaxis protein CheW [Pseudoduganella namucuonensis]|uniref:Twitching motility protein PilI n=1 Tax=Pseudoduganella namucuonensis TaxID=1035707 RepID=A0A1I7LJ30_9BURK|nr:chemotaxis protein CheW [Pseudoduganella namucuonensis]SFV09706.1 twitching motility protein PilI [Pseudoduganella namucuonensis]
MSSAAGDLPHAPEPVPVPASAPAPTGAERRSRLRRYQAQLLERMHAAKSGEAAAGRELGVQLGAARCLLDLTQVGEIVPFQPGQPLATVPLARDWYLGLANIRGGLTGVIDLARYLGEAATAPAAGCSVITFAPGLGFNCALLAARVLGLRKLDDMTARQPDGAAPAWCAQRFTDPEGQQWTRLDLALLVREAGFLQVGR